MSEQDIHLDLARDTGRCAGLVGGGGLVRRGAGSGGMDTAGSVQEGRPVGCETIGPSDAILEALKVVYQAN